MTQENKHSENMANNEEAPKKEIKPAAVDTGRRIDIGEASFKPSSVRRREFDKTKKPKDPEQTLPKPKAKLAKIDEAQEEQVKKVEKVKEEPIFTKNTHIIEPMIFDDSGDFASMLAESEQSSSSISVKVGDKVSGKVVHIGEENIFVALGPKLEAAIARSELLDSEGNLKLKIGDQLSSYVLSTQGGVVLSNDIAQSGLDSSMLEEAAAKKIPVEGKVMAVNKGGFDIQISGKRAFCPVGQIDEKFVEDTSSFVGRTLHFVIERIEESGRNIVVSRRALLDRKRREDASVLIKNLEIGKKYDAVIVRVADFGAFADIGGIEGLIPRSELAYGHVDRVSDVLSVNDKVIVELMSFEKNEDNPSKSRISLSLKKTQPDPYSLYFEKIKSGATLEGKVVRLESFGAFIQLFPGIDGLIHISELSEKRVQHPNEILSIGDPVTVRVIDVNEGERRISLSLRESVSRKKGEEVPKVAIARGQKTSGVISRIERYGVFLELPNGSSALLPQSETGLPADRDIHRAFSIGDALDVVVIDIDPQNRIRVSLLARKQMEERDSYLDFQSKEKQGGFGTFADLLKKKS